METKWKPNVSELWTKRDGSNKRKYFSLYCIIDLCRKAALLDLLLLLLLLLLLYTIAQSV
jgi:hypothetical protein